MDSQTNVMEYQCPCCGAGLAFSGQAQQLHCEYCGNTFDIDAVRAFNEKELGKEPVEEKWDHAPQAQWSEEEESSLNSFVCPSCGGEIVTDSQTAATFCPYCGNPAIMPSRLSGSLKPQGVIPFQTTKQDAQEFYAKLLKSHDKALKVLTDDCHYHTVAAPTKTLLDLIEQALQQKGFLQKGNHLDTKDG